MTGQRRPPTTNFARVCADPLPDGGTPPVAYVLKGGALCEVVGVSNALTPSTVHAALFRATRKPTRKRTSPSKAGAGQKAARSKAQAASPHRAVTAGRGRSAPGGTTKASSARVQARVRGRPAFPLTLRPTDTLATVYRRIQEHLATEGPNGPYTLSDGTTVPHKLFGPQDYHRTLEQLGLTNAVVVANDVAEPPIPELASEHDIKPAGGIVGYIGSWVSWAFGGGTPAPAPAPAPTHSNATRRQGNQRDSRTGDATSVVHRPGFGRNVHGLAHRGDDDGDKNEFFGGDSTMFQGRPDE